MYGIAGGMLVAVIVVGLLLGGRPTMGSPWTVRARQGYAVVREAKARCAMLGRMLGFWGMLLDNQSSLWFALQWREMENTSVGLEWVPLHHLLALAKPTNGREGGNLWCEEVRRSRK